MLIDMVALAAFNFLIMAVFQPAFFTVTTYTPEVPEQSLLEQYFGNPYQDNPYVFVDIGVGLLSFLYFWLFHAFGGQTLGKRICRLKVVDGKGGPVTLYRSGIRALMSSMVYLLPYVRIPFAAVDGLWIFGDGRKRCLHDVLAGTIVIDVTPVAPGPDGSRTGMARGKTA
jgi:uncharacterized RDD family membrane protein YckC